MGPTHEDGGPSRSTCAFGWGQKRRGEGGMRCGAGRGAVERSVEARRDVRRCAALMVCSISWGSNVRNSMPLRVRASALRGWSPVGGGAPTGTRARAGCARGAEGWASQPPSQWCQDWPGQGEPGQHGQPWPIVATMPQRIDPQGQNGPSFHIEPYATCRTAGNAHKQRVSCAS